MNKKIFDLKAVKNNLDYFFSKGKKVTIMIKANAYGHGRENILKCLKKYDVKLGVATIFEAEEVRKLTAKNILIVEPITDVSQMRNNNFEFCVEEIKSLKESLTLGFGKRCYLKLNIGMNRFGIDINDRKYIKKVAKLLKKDEIKGIICHFSQLEDEIITKKQYENFLKIRSLFSKNLSISFGGSNVINYPFEFDEIRVGIGFYGYENSNVKPILTLKSQILKIEKLKKGDSLGYSSGYIAPSNRVVAIVGVGYGDGINRVLKGFFVKIKGKKCQIIGNICMDCLFADITNVKCEVGGEVVLERADVVAKQLQTISYEVLTSQNSFRSGIFFEKWIYMIV